MVNDWVIAVLVIGMIVNTIEVHLLKRKLKKEENKYDESGTAEYY